jgi:gas vesicle protein/phage tail protein X
MGQDPSQIRHDIEDTRAEMGETVEALGYKADVPSRARDRVDSMKSKVTGKVSGATGRVSDATPGTGDMKQGARQAVGVAQENPLGLAIGAAAVGFVAGMLAPSTKVEDEKLGPMADQVKEKAKETGQEAMERGRHVAEQAAESAKETAREAGQEQAQELKESAQQSAQETRHHHLSNRRRLGRPVPHPGAVPAGPSVGIFRCPLIGHPQGADWGSSASQRLAALSIERRPSVPLPRGPRDPPAGLHRAASRLRLPVSARDVRAVPSCVLEGAVSQQGPPAICPGAGMVSEAERVAAERSARFLTHMTAYKLGE